MSTETYFAGGGRRAWLCDMLGPVMVVAVSAVFYVHMFSDVFPLIEYRQWTMVPDFQGFAKQFWFNAIVHSEGLSTFSRSTSFLGMAVIIEACGANVDCQNISLIGLILVSAIFLSAVGLHVAGRTARWIAAGSALFFLMSYPVVDSMAWQATSLDRFALFFTVVAIFYSATVSLSGLRGIRQAYVQAVLLALVILGLNAKEAAWSLGPSMGLLILVRLIAQAPSIDRNTVLAAVRRTVVLLWPAALYTLAHTVLVVVGFAMNNELPRVADGDGLRNAVLFYSYFFNTEGMSTLGRMAQLLVLVVPVSYAVYMVVLGRSHRTVTLLWIWSAVSFVMSVLIPLKTTAASPFYLLVPLFYLAIMLFFAALIVSRNLDTAPKRVLGGVFLVSFFCLHGVGFERISKPYLQLSSMSRNFRATLAAVGSEVSWRLPASLTFIYPPTAWRAYMFTGSAGPQNPALAKHILPEGSTRQSWTALDNITTDALLPVDGKVDLPPAGMAVFLKSDMSLDRLTWNGD